METYWGALGTVIAIYVLLRAERIELRREIRTLDERLSGRIRSLDQKFDRKFDGLVEMLAASGVLTRSGGLTRPEHPPLRSRQRR